MSFRIFGHLLIHHTWSATGRLVLSDPAIHSGCERASKILAGQGTEAERQSLLARLAYRGKQDSVMCRAARRLRADPCLPIRQLAAELGVSERYLSQGLRAVLGESAERLLR